MFLTGGAIRRAGARVETVVGGIYPLSRGDGRARGDNPFSALFANVWHAGIAAIEESENERARRMAAEAESFSHREFLATLSHEIRNPLSVIFANVGLLRARAERERDQLLLDRLSALERAGKHLRDIVSDVLDVAKVDAGEVETELAWFDLEPLLLEIEDMGISLTQGGDVLFLLDAPADRGRMYSDRLKLSQFF